MFSPSLSILFLIFGTVFTVIPEFQNARWYFYTKRPKYLQKVACITGSFKQTRHFYGALAAHLVFLAFARFFAFALRSSRVSMRRFGFLPSLYEYRGQVACSQFFTAFQPSSPHSRQYSRIAFKAFLPLPSRKGYNAHTLEAQSFTSFLLPRQQSKHFARITSQGVLITAPLLYLLFLLLR